MRITSLRIVRAVLVVAASPLVACAVGPADSASNTEPGATAPATAALETCKVDAPEGIFALKATAQGVVLGAWPRQDVPLTAQRMHGVGCDLTSVGAPVAAAQLLDADDHDNLYVIPGVARAPGVVDTTLPDEFPGGAVAKVDVEGRVSKLSTTGRGLWSFGIAPQGDALYMAACGPNGIFTVRDGAMVSGMTTPSTLWEQTPAVLTDAETFWSVGVDNCGVNAVPTPDCGFALVRTTPEGSEDVGTTLVAPGRVFERTELARCGEGVCAVAQSVVIVHDAEGDVVQTITLKDVGAADEHFQAASGNTWGVYVLLRGANGARVVFVPAAVTEDHGR